MAENIVADTELREIPGYPGYFINEQAEVWSHKVIGFADRVSPTAKKLKQQIDRYGYLMVYLRVNGTTKRQRLHRLMLMTFVGPPPSDAHQGCHNNDIKTDNRLDNLRWDTTQKNTADRDKHGLTCKGESKPNAKLTEAKVSAIREIYASGRASHEELAERFGVSPTTIYACIVRRKWKHVA